METLKKLFVVLSLSTFGCATAGAASPTVAQAPSRGAVVVAGPSVKALPAGPGTIHAYSAYAGGTIFAAPAVSGTDEDCRRPAGALTPMHPDRVVAFDVAPGQVACVASNRAGNLELLWHTTAAAPRAGAVLAAASRE